MTIIFQRYDKYHLFEKFINKYLLNNKYNAITPGTLATYEVDYVICNHGYKKSSAPTDDSDRSEFRRDSSRHNHRYTRMLYPDI